MSSATATGALARLRWADVAKGGCILLVVLHHVATKHFDAVVPLEHAAIGAAWTDLSHALKPVRMPLFFALSGMFASAAVRRPWPRVVRRVASPAYLYVVWLVVLGLVFTVETDLPMNRTQSLGELALDLVFASTGLWFLYALAVYFVVAKLLDRLPTAWLLGAAAAVAASASLLPIEEANRVSVLVHFVHFAVGVRCPHLLRRVAEQRQPALLGWLTVAFVAGSVLLALVGVPLSTEVVLLSLLGVPWGIRLAVAVARLPRTTAALAWVGRRSLPVYVLHVAVLAGLHHVAPGLPGGGDVASLLLVIAYPVLVTALVVACCLLARAALVRLGLGALFALPSFRRVDGLAARRPPAPVAAGEPAGPAVHPTG